MENLLPAWEEFIVGKRKKTDVRIFSRLIYDNIFELHEDLMNGSYRHGPYHAFRIADPKPRIIHKACVRDRLLHHAIHRTLYPFFDRLFILDSYSCRKDKGMHRAMDRFRRFAWKASQNHTRTCWVLKCDIRKFFASIDQRVLLRLLQGRIEDARIVSLLSKVIFSFQTGLGTGIPLGNLTSQLFANVYLHALDEFVKHSLRCKHYIRYADDFMFLDVSRERLLSFIPAIRHFLGRTLLLTLHEDKVRVRTLASGVDFLGWVHFPHHRVLRATSRRRMMKRVAEHPSEETVQSYIGMLGHGNAHRLRSVLLHQYWLLHELCD